MMQTMLRYVEQTRSTNHDLMEEVLSGGSHGMALYTDDQRAGRGRHGRPWTSPPKKNLAVSIAVIGERYRRDLELIPLATGVAVADLLASDTSVVVQLKWPNDLLIGNKKCAGILCEGVQKGMQLMGVVIGIGLNLNMQREDIPEDLQKSATSIAVETGHDHDLHRMAEHMRIRVLQEIDALADGGKAAMLARWQERDVTKGRRVQILSSGTIGTADGISRTGGLRVRMDDGSMQEVRSGEVHLLPLLTG